MRVAIVSKSDARGGGASRVAEDLAAGLNRIGHHAKHFIAHRGVKEFSETLRPLYGSLGKPVHFGQKVCRKIGIPDVVPFELPILAMSDIARDYDAIHFHDLTTAVAPWTVRWLSARRPCFWTFHDCSPFTGGCFYPQDCDRFRGRCGEDGGCPQIGRFPTTGTLDLTGFIQSTKTALHATGRILAIAPSQWMADLAFSSGKLPRRPCVVANGVDLTAFRPAWDKGALRTALGLPETRPIVLISAGDLRDPRKGFRHAIDALRTVRDLAPFAVVIGNAETGLRDAMGDLDFKAVGYVEGAPALSRWYSAADVFLFCSLADNQPLSILETMACGVPLVGFATGGIPEMVESGITGIVVPQRDAAALAGALRSALAPGTAAAWGLSARRRAERDYSSDSFLARHVSLYLNSAVSDSQRACASSQPRASRR